MFDSDSRKFNDSDSGLSSILVLRFIKIMRKCKKKSEIFTISVFVQFLEFWKKKGGGEIIFTNFTISRPTNLNIPTIDI